MNGSGVPGDTPWTGVAAASVAVADPFERVILAVMGQDHDAARAWAEFVVAETPRDILAAWIRLTRPYDPPAPHVRAGALIQRDVARIDALMNAQVNAVLHHERFQQLEASWRGLETLASCIDALRDMDTPSIKLRMLDVSWRELGKDLDRAMEFDQSHIFRKVYSEEFDTPGGQPFSVLLGDYEIRHRPGPGHKTNDLSILQGMAQVAAAAFAPFIVSADPVLLGLDGFRDLEIAQDLPRTFAQVEYTKWKSFRASEDARFVGVTLPRVLMRCPYEDEDLRAHGFRFKEDVQNPDRSGYLWGTAVYAFGTVLLRAFADCGWLADIRGAPTDEWAGGLVVGLPVHSFRTDREGIAPKYSTDVLITDDREKELADLGFIPLCQLRGTEYSAFFSNQSLQVAKQYDKAEATTNARLSAMLQYLLCVARFAHYLKVMARDKVGSFKTASECERYLQAWVLNYCTASTDLGLDTRAKYPLSEAQVGLREHPAKPGKYVCVMHLKPHFQLDQIVSAVKLVTELAPLSV